jgi:hypothetical protein
MREPRRGELKMAGLLLFDDFARRVPYFGLDAAAADGADHDPSSRTSSLALS